MKFELNHYELYQPLAFCRLCELLENKEVWVADMYALGWRLGSDGWKGWRRIFAWENKMWGKRCCSIG